MIARLCLILIIGLMLPWAEASADLVVVVNPRSGVDRLTLDEAVNIFMGRYRKLPSGLQAQPIDQPETSPDKARFYRLLVDKELSEINAYWARLTFSGKTSRPIQAKSAAEIIDRLVRQPGAVGYIERSQADHRLRIVLDLER